MITILKNIECYAPEYLGIKDIVIVKDIIYKILEPNSLQFTSEYITVLNCDGLIATPGIIDGHVHIIGGGGEEGFSSQISEIDTKDILLAGITTVVGLLGADNQTKTLKSLLAKAKALEHDGITTYIYIGSYSIPVITFTGDITSDMVLIDKVIGVGELALSDHRSSNPDIKQLLEVATKTHLGGLISGKAGLFHLHIGDGKSGLTMLKQLVHESDLPKEQFLPTHVNRNRKLFKQAIKYTKNGGYIDMTAGEQTGLSIPDALDMLLIHHVNMHHVTISSDANGSIPNGGVGKIQTLFDDLIHCIKKGMNPEIVFSLATKNISTRLKLYPKKGILQEGSDADILIMDKDYKIDKLFCMGKLMVDKGKNI